MALVLIAAACGEAESPAEPSSGGPGLAPGEFRIEKSTAEQRAVRVSAATGEIEQLRLPLAAQIAQAWGIHPHDLTIQTELPSGAFDIRVRAADGKAETARALLRGGLVQHLGIQVRQGTRSGELLALRLVKDGLKPEPVAGPLDPSLGARVRGRYRGAGAPIADLIRFLRPFGKRPIIDETGLRGSYDITVEWDPEAGGRAMRAALRDAGFLLVGGEGDYPVWLVEPAP